MALPLLPENSIIVEFLKLETICNGLNFPKLTQLYTYVKNNWIYGKVWISRDFCHFRMLIRTNNEVEGAHFNMICQVPMQHKPFYSLVNNLHREAQYIQYKVLRLWNNENLI